MLTVQYSLAFASEGFTFVAVSPGVGDGTHLVSTIANHPQQWIQTDLGGPTADLTVEQGAKATADVVFRVTEKDTGKFFNIHVPGWEEAEGLNQYAGENPPW